MTENQIVTLRALVELGLDLATGLSPEISIKVLETHSGIRQTSNGSRVVRRDSRVFSLFKIVWNYDNSNGNLVSVTFNGYKTGEDIVLKLREDHTRYSEKINRFQGLLNDTEKFITFAENNKIQDLSVEDLADLL